VNLSKPKVKEFVLISFEDAKQSVVVNYNDEIKSKVMNNYIYSIIDKYDVIIGEYK